MPVVGDIACNESYSGQGYEIADSMICAGLQEGLYFLLAIMY